MAIVALVPARCGSKSIPFKNVKSFCGKPLIYWNLKALNDAPDVTYIHVATDCDEIEQIVNDFNFSKVGVYRRNKENANDTASTESVMLEFLGNKAQDFKADDLFILSQITNPFTTSMDFSDAINQLKNKGGDSLLSCAPIKRFFWNKNGTPQNYDYLNRPRRQDFDGTYIENGAFYINTIGNIQRDKNRLSGKISIYEMPEYTQIEIDEPHDWIIAEGLFKATVYHSFLPTVNERVKNIKIVLTDVDGVLTDAGMYYSEKGDELKKFNTHDGMAFSILHEKGFKTGIITSETTEIVTRRAAKLKVDYVYQGKRDGGKLEAIKEICFKENIGLNDVAYIGDDINCIAALEAVGFAACPANATSLVKAIAGINILQTKGGEGAFREFAGIILSNET
ncbi:acylneuraminate cytidylyltransferase [Inquilinus sp. KBS0705]|nr:acylneuraminate cytidylyltransferase [Inquilinus sp. KBS0705]